MENACAENNRTGKWQNAGTANAGTGKFPYWKMPVLENASTGVLPCEFLIGCELVYEPLDISCEKISLCWK